MGVPKHEQSSDGESLAELLSRMEPLARDEAAALPAEGEPAPNVEDALRRLGEPGCRSKS